MAYQSEVRIIGGKFRSRKITFPDHPDLRPTPNRVRETLFNWLQQEIVGARCLDVFAGSGALGFEAMSRGASSIVFMERDRAAHQALESNALTLGITEFLCLETDSMAALNKTNHAKTFDLVFLDPPFSETWLVPCLQLLKDNHWLSPGATIYIESPLPFESLSIPQDFEIYKNKKAGQVYYGLVRYLTKS